MSSRAHGAPSPPSSRNDAPSLCAGHPHRRDAGLASTAVRVLLFATLVPRKTSRAIRTSALLSACLVISSPVSAADEIHWTFTGPTSVSFDWRGSEDTLRYGLTPGFGFVAVAETPSPLPWSSSGPWKEARLTGLLPNTTYHYAIGDGIAHTFRTLPGPNAQYPVYVEGDIGDVDSYWRMGEVQSLIAADPPAFVLAVGDLTYGNAHGPQAIDNHFNDVMVWSRDAAYMPAWGNHEWETPTVDDMRNYKGRFDLPNPHTSPGAPAPGCCGEDWYWLDSGTIRFIAYPEPWSGALVDWRNQADALMDQAQADTAIRFIVTFGHRPAHSSGHYPNSTALTGYLDELGASHDKYVLNFNGHSHDYERTYPINGVVHVTAGIGGTGFSREPGPCPYGGGCPPPSWSAFRAYHHGAVRLGITPTSILVEAICGPPGDSGSNLNDITCSPGEVFDSYQIGVPPVAGVEEGTAARAGLAIESITPSPARSEVEIRFQLPDREPARLECFDVLGRAIVRRELGTPGPGPHSVRLDLGGSTPNGVY